MKKKRKVILSRKGFDDSTGGKPSPILNGKCISLPIPRADSDMFYKDLYVEGKLTYRDIMRDLNIRFFSEGHVDPDIKRSALLNRHADWRGLFGQSGTAQAILDTAGVTSGDIFLYYGWFREVEFVKGGYKYKKKAPDIHTIFGYLEVDEVYDLTKNVSIPSWATYHPHVASKGEYSDTRNALYIASKTLSFNDSKKGWGSFSYHDKLQLSQKGQDLRSTWDLPSCFEKEEKKFKGVVKYLTLPNERIQVRFIGRNSQELFITDKEDIVRWAEDLIENCPVFE